MSTISCNVVNTQQRINQACLHFSRGENLPLLLAVSKKQPVEKIRQAYQAGIRCFGESYVQEAITKIESLRKLDISWHFIGPIQSNKTCRIAQCFSWVHSVDRSKVVARLNHARNPKLPPLNICLQVQLVAEKTKAGVAHTQLLELAERVLACKNLNLRGLMTIPPVSHDFRVQKDYFEQLGTLRNSLAKQLNHPLDTLSMGMSGDLEAAICAGSTIVRVGTAIFGARQ